MELTEHQESVARTFMDEALVPLLEGELSPADVLGLSLEERTQLLQMGVSMFAVERHEQAERAFELMCALEPANYIPHHYLGMIYHKRGQPAAAIAAFEQAGVLLEALDAPTPDQLETLDDIQLMLAQALVDDGQAQRAAVLFLDLRARADRLDANVRSLVELYLGRLGAAELGASPSGGR